MRHAGCGEEIRLRPRLVEQPIGRQQRVQARGDREALLGERQRGLEQRRPAQPAVPPMCLAQQREHARDADGPPASDRGGERQRLAVHVEKAVRRRRCRRGLATVVGDRRVAARVVDQHERAAADARGLRLDQRQNELRGDRGIDRAAAAAQHPVGRVDGVGFAAATMK